MTTRLPLALGLAFLFAPSVTAQTTLNSLDTWQRQAQWQLFQHRVRLDLDDLTHEVGIGSLAQGETASFEFTVEGGASYRALAVCDNDCSDVDLRLFGLDGTQIDEDIELDDYPYVDTTKLPGGSTRLRVDVVMASCTASPCRFALAVFQR